MKRVSFLRNEFVWGLLRSIDEFKIISSSSEFGFITSSPALHLCVRQGSEDQVDSRWSAAVPGGSNLAWTKPQIYYSILISILSWTKVQTNGRTVSTVLTIPKYKRIIFGKLFWKQLALNSQTPYIGCINWLPLRDFILWENQIKFNWGRLGSIWETSLF